MDMNEIRQRFLEKRSVSQDEERFFLNNIRRGRAAALETRKATVARASAAASKRGSARPDSERMKTLDSLL